VGKLGTFSFCCILLGICPWSESHAQAPVIRIDSLTLHRAVMLALDNQPLLRAADANVRSASAGLTQAQANYYPSFNLSASATRTDGAFVLNPSFPPRNQSYNTYATGLAIQQTLWDFGRTSGRVSANDLFVEASSSDYRSARDNVVMNVQVAYFGVVEAQRVVTVDQEAVDQASKHLEQAKAFYRVGRRPLFDVTKAEVDLANANVNLIRARNQFRLAKVQLENAMGAHPSSTYILADSLQVTPFLLTLDSAKTVAFGERPDLQSARARLAGNRSLVSATWAQHLPILSASGNWNWTNFDFPLFSRWNAGVTLSLPLFQGFSVVGQVEQAEANADAAQAAINVLEESIVLEVEQTFLGMREAEERLAAASKLVEQADQNLTLAERQYAAGVGTPLEVTDAQLARSNARITYIQALYDYSSSFSRLQKAMGTIGK
jgi:outer membrane protein